jgi:hypothetical protein
VTLKSLESVVDVLHPFPLSHVGRVTLSVTVTLRVTRRRGFSPPVAGQAGRNSFVGGVIVGGGAASRIERRVKTVKLLDFVRGALTDES